MWLEGFLPKWMYPKDIGVVITVRSWPQGKWLQVSDPEKKMNDKILKELEKLEVPIHYYDKLFGPPEFTEFIKDYERKISNLLPPISE